MTLFLFLPLSLSRLSSVHHQLPGCSGSLDECLSCISPISPAQITQSAVLLGERCGLPSTHAHLCPPQSPDPSPYQPRTHSCRDSNVDTLSTGPVTTPVITKKPPKILSAFLFLARLNRSSGTLPVDAYTPTHKQFFLSIRLKLTVFTLAFP